MDCFACFSKSTEQAATTIGKYYRGNVARGERKKIEAKKHLTASLHKVTLFSHKPRSIKLTDDEKGLLYIKPKTTLAKMIPFGDVMTASQQGQNIKLELKGPTPKTYTLQAVSVERARNFIYGLSIYVDPKVIKSPVVAPASVSGA